MAKKLEGAGLRGQVAGQTSLSTVGKEGHGLTYRGYAIEDLADKAKFEEVAYLLLYGHLPNKTELEAYQQKLISNRKLPEELKKTLELIHRMRDRLVKGSNMKSFREELELDWKEGMIWWGPGGIGASYTIDGYMKGHTKPFQDGLELSLIHI